jgi:hypothetical protein
MFQKGLVIVKEKKEYKYILKKNINLEKEYKFGKRIYILKKNMNFKQELKC